MKRMLLWIVAVLMMVSLLACTAEKKEKEPVNNEISENVETDEGSTGEENEDSEEGVINFDDLIAAAG